MENNDSSGRRNPLGLQIPRRSFLKGALLGLGGVALLPPTASASILDSFFQKHFNEMNESEIKAMIARLEQEAADKWGRKITIDTTKAQAGVRFAYGLDLSRCIGCRKCVHACVAENNQSRDPQVQWISVLRFAKGEKWLDLENSEKYYDPEKVPEEGYFYLPVQCQQCDNPPCVKVCPSKATWQEPDGIVTIDYNWCIGCRYCMAACPYGARRFNWGRPSIDSDEVNPHTHYLGNRPRYKGTVEKCTFCVQRTRAGKYPACVEACPVGARKFGNILDPDSEIRYLIDNKRVFRLKEDLNTEPKFFYFYAT